MSIIINTNISSMLGVTALNKNTNAMNKALERLSTGCRINSSKDDAAGCAISTSLTKEVSSLNVAQNNAQMGQSLIDTANGALSNMSNMLHRIRDLAEQSANGAYGDDERKAMQSEVNNLVSELYRTKNSTEFNGKQILGTESTHPITEEEAIAEGYTTVHTAQELKEALRTNDPNCKVMLFADINLDDLGVDGTGSNWNLEGYFRGVFDGNGFTISNLKINAGSNGDKGFFNDAVGATIKNVVLENVEVTSSGGRIAGLVGQAFTGTEISNCSVTGTVTGGSGTAGLVGAMTSTKIENCTTNVTVTGTTNVGGIVGNSLSVASIENCSSSSSVICTGRFGNTGGIVGIAQGTLTIKNCSSSGTVEGTVANGGIVGRMSGASTLEECESDVSVTGTAEATTGAIIGRTAGTPSISGNKYNSTINDGMKAIGNWAEEPSEDQIEDDTELVVDTLSSAETSFSMQVGIDSDKTSVINANTGFILGAFNIDISTEKGAISALSKLDKIMTNVTKKQTELGAASSRLDSAMQYQQIQRNTKIATNSIIKDADFAAESSNYIKQQILQQTTSSLLSTANQNPNIALMLLNMNR